MLTVKLDCGILPALEFWNGPPKLSLIGPLSVLDPDGSTVTARLRSPLEILCEPVNVCLSSVAASPLDEELLLPHAATPSEARTAKTTAAATRGPRIP